MAQVRGAVVVRLELAQVLSIHMALDEGGKAREASSVLEGLWRA